MFKYADRVKESTTTTGTGAVSLAGAAAGFRAFASVLANGDRCFYMIQGQATTEWETGIGLFSTSGTTLTREQVLSSSNADAAVTFSAGPKDVVLLATAVAFGHTGSEYFGDGTLGKVTITTTVTLADDAHYEDLTISGAGKLVTNGWIVRVNGVLDLSNAAAGAIVSGVAVTGSLIDGGVGGATGTPGTSAIGVLGNSFIGGTPVSGSAGGTGSTTTGGQGSAGGTGRMGGDSGASGAGGTGSGGAQAGGALRGAISLLGLSNANVPHVAVNILNRAGGLTPLIGGSSGAGGGAGGGSGAAAGGGGGAGGAGGGVMAIYARFIKRGGSTAAGAVQCNGGKGGAGGSASTATCGGGGGGAGGGGGWTYIVCQALMGTTATNALECSGGDGGAGGNGNTTGVGGNGGQGGGGGRMTLINMGLPNGNVYNYSGATSGAAGTAGSGTTGGALGAGTVYRVNL